MSPVQINISKNYFYTTGKCACNVSLIYVIDGHEGEFYSVLK